MNKNERSAQRVSGLTLLRAMGVFVVVILAGCAQKIPVPYFARAGDTIILGLGGIQRNVNGEQHLMPSDLLIKATKTGSGLPPITLNASWVFKTFTEYSSQLNSTIFAGNFTAANFVPFDGGWFVSVNLPNDGSLTPGSYTLSITSPTGKLLNTKYSGGGPSVTEGDLTNLPLEIATGTGGNSDYASQFSSYTNAATLDISPNTLAGVSAVSGLQLAITYPQTRYDPAHLPMVLPYSHNPYIQLSQNVVDNGNGTKTMLVLLSTQQAFVPLANQTPFTPLLSDLSLHMLFFVGSGQNYPSAAQLVSDFQVDPSRSHYYDTSGAVISSMQPTVSFKQQ